MDKYLRINGYFKLPDNCDLDSLEDYEYLRKAANELKKSELHETSKRNAKTIVQKIKLFFEMKLWNLSDHLQWKRYWDMRDEKKFKHTYYMTVGDRYGTHRHVED